MFESIYSPSITAGTFFAMAFVALLSGIVFSWLMSFRVRASRRFFIVSSIMPFVIGAVLTFVNGSIGAGMAFGGAFALTRFRSAQGTADEIATVLITVGAGVAFGMGYLTYGVLILLATGLVFLALSMLPIFEHAAMQEEKLLKVTIPESLDYTGVFEDAFARYLSRAENVGVKTTNMGSMFRLSFKIRLKDPSEERAFINELRTRNGNLEISILPYVEPQAQL